MEDLPILKEEVQNVVTIVKSTFSIRSELNELLRNAKTIDLILLLELVAEIIGTSLPSKS